MPRFLYSALFYCLLPVICLRLMWRAVRSPNYAKRWGERFGFVGHSDSDKEIIWLHAVSVGETLAAVTLVKALQEKYPAHRLMVTCMTPTGSERILAAFGGSVEHSYAPYDMPDAVARFLARVRPKLLIIMETELWPNTIAACTKRNIPVILVNGRLSDKSARAYQRINCLVRPMLNGLHTVAAKHKDDAQRFQSLGLSETAVMVTGNIKFDLNIDPALKAAVERLSKDWRGTTQRRVFLAASTHKGEDEIILAAFAKIKTQLDSVLLVLVPRHPERFNQVAELCHSAGFSLVRRSANTSVGTADILLGDSMGELMTFFGACDLAFVGGSLVPTGGHNMIEAAAWGTPVLTGPHLFNFSEVAQLLIEAGGMKVCQDFDDLADQCTLLLQDEPQRTEMGDAARRVAEANRGALDRLLAVITQII
ncbi:MAG: lipid IV(A) 3-deoxy-D-manno-octulosonic acid transferase [Proteobacteria bacterium]|jgi:3-deoxy-D-manno-octulosonic-acid transferase|uniref:3-deoxy-D-manno-octulosonic acid transferase n=1 Tax=SAR92 bacterium BACL26 MAG-121220-bin70 TaxID=1655626 RepID=A0A0R2UDV3_9GAMM|nr:MAG: 3-deoxy-D-manno-octulosonic acid transferase [SAR92 bacterium BACL26 MAG-121220-bin70]MDA0796461.1 lipid IV(A) 3-deoxy-D-manno-octulosonic acid transferase [Pseudomonadota bacterium]MDA1352154.1 lipid IV(A) 3-deoxy-D-manno-octulosonic acid transferase [Pseudomonadota bacterium]